MKNIYKNTILIIALAVVFSSCKKFVEIESPKNQLTSDKVFADSLGANSAILGVYTNMMQAFGLDFSSGALTVYSALSADELYLGTSDLTNAEFYQNALTSSNTTNRTLWSNAYNFVYGTNACIEGIESSNGISPSAKNSMLAEIKTIRAYLYFNLMNIYGDIPLALTTNYSKNRVLTRSATSDAYQQIIADLKFAQAVLSESKFSTERVNFYAVTALLSKIYLYDKKYQLSKDEADKVINSGKFLMEPDLNTVFLARSKETLWRFLPVYPGRETWEGYYFVPSSNTTVPNYVITDQLFNSFESGDKRKISWIKINTAAGKPYPYPYKYKLGSTTSTPTESYVILRLAELYLIRSEAKANLDDVNGSTTDLNLVRRRSGLDDILPRDKPQLLLAIEKERQAELFCESGNRWFDLKRTGRINSVLSLVKPNWVPSASLYPIPISEVNANPNLVQNLGYN